MRRILSPLPLVLALAACSDPAAVPSPADAATDVVSDAPALDAGDVAPDQHAADTTTDAPPDVTDVDAPPPDAPSDAPPDVMMDVTRDAPPADVPADVAADVAADAPADAGTDTAPPCVDGAYRCTTDAGAIERCAAGAWVAYVPCSILTSGTRETCSESACLLCAIPDGGTGCGTLCTTDGECHDRERARCVGGRCARRGWVRCASNPDCTGFSQGTGLTDCADGPTIDGAVVRTCGGRRNNSNCTSDAMCPRDMRCDTATGFCIR